MSNQSKYNLAIWLFLLVGLFPHRVLGQYIQAGELPQTLCAGATATVSFTATGSFQPGNSFRIDLVDQFDRVLLTTTDNVLSGGTLLRVPTNVSLHPVEYFIRIVASKPLTVSNYALLRINGIPSATLQQTPAIEPSINPGEPFNVPVALAGGGPYSLSFTDGTTRDLDDVGQASLLLYPDQTKTYQLAAVSNRCGAGRAGGTATAIIKSAGLLVTRLSTTEPCAGKPLDIFFSSDRPLPANTTFRVDLQPIGSDATAYTLPVTGNISPLRVVLPTTIATGGAYRLRLFSEEANVSAYYRNALGDVASQLLVRHAPSVRLSGTTSAGYGQVGQLTASVTGLGNGLVTLNDGTVVSLSAIEQEGPRSLPVRANQTTTYTVRSVSNGCGLYGAEAGSGSATLTVQLGYRIDSLSSGSVCAGQSFQVYFSTNETLSTDAGSYRFRGSTSLTANELGGNLIDFIVQQVRVGSQPNTGILTVQARSLPADYLTNTAHTTSGTVGVGWFYGQLSRGGNTGNIYEKRFSVADRPQLLLQETPFIVNRPQVLTLPAQLASHTPFTDVLLSDNTRLSIRSEVGFGQKSRLVFLEALASQSGTLRVMSVQNSCGVGAAQGSVAIQVRGDTTGLFMRPIPNQLCAGASVSVAFTMLGSPGGGATYRVELTDDDGLFRGKFLANGTASPITVTIPAGFTIFNRLQLRVVSSPASGTLVLQSAAREFTYLDAAQLVRLTVAGTGGTETVVRPGQPAQLRLLVAGAGSIDTPTRVVLSDGQPVAFNSISTDIPVRPLQTTTYTIRSVQNSCGAAAGVGTVTVRVQPFTMQPLLQKRLYCEGDSLETHLLVQGDIPPQATHAMQVLLNSNVVQTLPARLANNRLTASLPNSFSVGTLYGVRVLTTVGNDQFYSQVASQFFQTYRRARLQLTPPNNQTAVVLEANQSGVTVQLSNPADGTAGLLSTPHKYRINEQPYTTLDNVPASVPLFATGIAPTSYSISGVYDAICGFGEGAGAVRISYRPGLRSLTVSKNQLCRNTGNQTTVNYEMAGDFPADTRFTLFLTNTAGVRTRVGESAKQVDKLTIAIDSLLAPGTYQVSVSLPPGLPAYTNFPTITIGERPNVIIAGGTSIQYSDQAVSVGVRVLAGYLPISMTLTNGLTQTLFETDNVLTFSPQQNTTYQIARVTNSCGVGRSGGVVSVTVLPPQTTEIRVTTLGPPEGVTGICQGGSVRVGLLLKGPFTASNQFTVYLSDSTGQNYRPLATRAIDATTLLAALPAGVVPATGYRVRIGASNPELLGAASGTFFTVRPALQAVISGSRNLLRDELTPVLITINNTGPWSVSINNSLYGLETAVISTSPFQYLVRPETSVTYTLTGVYNQQCGNGRVLGSAVLTTTNPLSINPALPLSIRVMPNPTAGRVRLEGTLPTPRSVTIRLTDATGRTLQTHTPGLLENLNYEIDLSLYAAGSYLLTVEADDQRTVFKLVKH